MPQAQNSRAANLKEPRPAYRGITTINSGYHEQAEQPATKPPTAASFSTLCKISSPSQSTNSTLSPWSPTPSCITLQWPTTSSSSPRPSAATSSSARSSTSPGSTPGTSSAPMPHQERSLPGRASRSNSGWSGRPCALVPPQNPRKSAHLTCPSPARKKRRALQGRRRRRGLQEPGSGD
jgi:hypothetical protein